MKKFVVTLLAASAITIAGCSDDADANSNSNDGNNDHSDTTLTFGVTPWTSTVPPTKVAGKILEDEMGYDVEEIEAEPGNVYAGLADDVDVFMDSWYPNQEQYVDEFSDDIESISVSYDDADSGMVIPEYMEGIEDVGDLKGKEDMVDNKIYGIDEGDPAMENMEKVIDAYDLDLELVTSSESAMLSTAEEKMDDEEPVLFYGWRPHTMFNEHDLKILTNEDAPGDFFQGSEIHVIANKDLEDEAPDAYEALSNWSIDIDDVEEMIARIDNDEDPDEVAQDWIDDHQDEVDEITDID